MLDADVWRELPLGPLPTLIGGTLGLAFLVTVALLGHRAGARVAARVGLALAVVGVLAITLRSGVTGSLNLVPGRGISSELHNVNRALGVVNVLGNVVLFVPIGWLLVVLIRRPTRAVASCVGLSVLIEATQYVVGRSADIDDVLLNAAGACVGVVAAAALVAVTRSELGGAGGVDVEAQVVGSVPEVFAGR